MIASSVVESIQRSVLLFVSTYGLVAVFAYMVLETSLLLHFVPSEVVVPFAAALLVTDPLSFALFVLVTTSGATVGSVVAYYLFGRNGARVLDRYGRYVRVSGADLDRWERWFHRWGETSVFWGRLLPVVRALVSVPAGAAGMDLRRFVGLSAAGAFVFDFVLTYLVYAGERSGTPVRVVLDAFASIVLVNATYIRSHPRVVVAEALVVAAVAAVLWRNRVWIRTHPGRAKRRVLSLFRVAGLLFGFVLVSSALGAPDQAFAAVVSVWNDPLALTALGLSRGQALLTVGALAVGVTLVCTELLSRVSVLRLVRRVRDRPGE